MAEETEITRVCKTCINTNLPFKHKKQRKVKKEDNTI